MLKCDLASDRLESTLAERDACRAAAGAQCAGKRGGLASKETTRDLKITAKCGALALADVLARLGFGTVCPAAASVGDLVTCLDASLEARTEGIVGTTGPRTCRLLEAAGQITDFEDACVPACGNGVDVVSSEDDADNTLLGPLHDFLVRNTP